MLISIRILLHKGNAEMILDEKSKQYIRLIGGNPSIAQGLSKLSNQELQKLIESAAARFQSEKEKINGFPEDVQEAVGQILSLSAAFSALLMEDAARLAVSGTRKKF